MKKMSFALFVVSLMGLLGCSGHGRNLGGGGRYCDLYSLESFGALPAGAQEVASYSAKDNKGSLEEIITPQNLPVGNYFLHSVDFMYLKQVNPNNRRRWIMTQIRKDVDVTTTERTKDGNTYYKSSVYCAAGYLPGDTTYEATMSTLTGLKVHEGGKMEWSVETLGYGWDSAKSILHRIYQDIDPSTGKIKDSWTKAEDSTQYQAPKDVYGDLTSEMRLYRLSDQNLYELYSQVQVDEKTYLMIRTILRHSDL